MFSSFSPCRYAAILFKKQRYVSAQHRLSIKIVCKDNFKYEVQERAATNAVSIQQLAEEYWRSVLVTSGYHCNMASAYLVNH